MREDTLLRPATTGTTAPLTGVALTATGRGFPFSWRSTSSGCSVPS